MWFFAGSFPVFHGAVFQVKIKIACVMPSVVLQLQHTEVKLHSGSSFFCYFLTLFMLPGIEQALFTHGIALGIQTLLVVYNSL